MQLEREDAHICSLNASAGSLELGSSSCAALSASQSCERSLKRSAEEAAVSAKEAIAEALDAAAGEVSGVAGQLVHGYASSSNLSACTEVEDRLPERPKRLRLMRLAGGAVETCTGDSDAQPSCSAR